MARSIVPFRSAPRALAVALAILVLVPLPVRANVPTAGASRGAFPDIPDQVVTYRWGASTYPAWVTLAAQDSLDTKYRSWTANNSHAPRPAYGAAGTAIVYYSALRNSPCNTVLNPLWLACATNGGTSGFRIHLRDLDKAPNADWLWWEKTGSCRTASGTTASGCWYVGRTLIHEAGHAIPGFGHDSQTEDDTVMRPTTPVVGAYGGDHRTFQRCDQAALQILWDVLDPARPYGDCFDGVPGHGVRGLVTTASTNGTSFTSCVRYTKLVGGRLAVKTEPLYGRLSNNPIAGRTLWFDRKPRAATTWSLRAESTLPTSAQTGTNWTRSFGAPSSLGGTWDYRLHFDGDAGLDPSTQPIFSIAWTVAC